MRASRANPISETHKPSEDVLLSRATNSCPVKSCRTRSCVKNKERERTVADPQQRCVKTACDEMPSTAGTGNAVTDDECCQRHSIRKWMENRSTVIADGLKKEIKDDQHSFSDFSPFVRGQRSYIYAIRVVVWTKSFYKLDHLKKKHFFLFFFQRNRNRK